ncbi:MAG: flagellar hook-length control protein FliK, partial [Archangium sp.]|nr:flagellar hook-length control protein FliK [Archangium sp.]
KLVAKPPPPKAPPPPQQNMARSAIAKALQEADAHAGQATKEGVQTRDEKASVASSRSRHQASLGAQAKGSEVSEGQRRGADSELAMSTAQGRANDGAQVAKRADGRAGDAKLEKASKEHSAASSDSTSTSSEPAGAGVGTGAREAGEMKTDADSGGKQQGGQKDNDGAAAAGFRFNPALMAPVPVAQKKDVAGSERLRRLAAELAQKIVERVRVGTNTLGRVEFQIDLRSDVLAGLSVKVSSHNGKIKATFTGHDKDVLKLLESQGEALKEALQSRGLSLDEFKVERR